MLTGQKEKVLHNVTSRQSPFINSDTQPAHRDWRLRKQDLVAPEKVTLLREALSGHTVRKVKCAPLGTELLFMCVLKFLFA